MSSPPVSRSPPTESMIAGAKLEGTGGTISGINPAATIALVYAWFTRTLPVGLSGSEVAVTAMIGNRGDTESGRYLVARVVLLYPKQAAVGPGRTHVAFDDFRKSLEDLMARAAGPADRREVAA